MLLLALAIAPGIAIMWYIYLKDKYDREPLLYLLVSFILGMLSTLPAIIFQLIGEKELDFFPYRGSIGYYAIFAYALVAFSEEGSKFLMLRFYAYPKKAFNEPFDGIVYSVMVGMGFATLENILYVFQGGIGTALLRMFLSVPAHGSFAVLMGYHVGLAKFDPPRSGTHMLTGLLLAILFHGTFDLFLFLQNSAEVTRSVSSGLLFLGAVASFWIAIRLSMRSIRLHQELSRITNGQEKNEASA